MTQRKLPKHTCGECRRRIIPVALATEQDIPADQSIVRELGLLCPRDNTLVVDLNQRACDFMASTIERETKGRSKK